MSQLERKSHSGTNIFGNLPDKVMLIKYYFHYLFVLAMNPNQRNLGSHYPRRLGFYIYIYIYILPVLLVLIKQTNPLHLHETIRTLIIRKKTNSNNNNNKNISDLQQDIERS